jgi:3-methyladenine DNA glycosylase AlkD
VTDLQKADINRLRASLESGANPEKQEQMERYMRNLFPFLGLQKPTRVELSKSWLQEQSQKNISEIKGLIHLLWQEPEREFQYVGMELMLKSSLYKNDDFPELLQYYIKSKSWWDTVDFLAANLLGKYLKAHPSNKTKLLRNWGMDENMWVCRSAIIAQLTHRNQTDLELLSELIEIHRESKEFFLQKAIGWALREVAKRQPIWVQEFCHRTKLQSLSRREALKNIPKSNQVLKSQ